MISRKNRFHGRNSVARVRGSVSHSTYMSFRYAPNRKNDYRLAVVVSKKVAPKAYVRNRIRRRIFEIVRTQKRLQNISIDVIVYVKDSKLAIIEHDVLSKEVAILTKKALSSLH